MACNVIRHYRLESTHRKKKVHEFSSPSGMSLTKLPLGRNNYDVIIPAQGEFGSDIPAGDEKLANLFYGAYYRLEMATFLRTFSLDGIFGLAC